MENFFKYFLWGAAVFFAGAAIFGGTTKLAKLAWTGELMKAGVGEVYVSESVKPEAGITKSTQEKEEEPLVAGRDRGAMVSMLFVGDIMLDRGVNYSVSKRGDGDFSFMFKNADFLRRPHITFGNLEGPVSDKGSNKNNLYSFRMNPAVVDALVDAGFDAVSVANNHAGDWGREAFGDTLARLEEKNILAVGGGYNIDDAQKVKILEVNGIKIGFIGFSDVVAGPENMEASENSFGLLMIKDDFADIIKQAAGEVDYLVVSYHFGNEYQKEPNSRQIKIARASIDAGAKMVIGHHPHVIQEVENYNGGIIAYSLGNFVFDQNFSEDTMRGLALEVVVDKNGIVEASKEVIDMNKFFQPEIK